MAAQRTARKFFQVGGDDVRVDVNDVEGHAGILSGKTE